MRVKMIQGVAGQVENDYENLQPGDVIEVADEARARRYIDHKLCEPVDQKTAVTARALKPGAHY